MKIADCIIRRETPADYRENEEMIRQSFWNVYRPGCMEHYLLHRLRTAEELVGELNLVMEQGGRLIGQCTFTRSAICADDGRRIPVLTLGPICIRQEWKRQGCGTYLLNAALEKAAALGYGAVCLEGNYDFYRHGGFVRAAERGLRYGEQGVEADFFLCRELVSGYLRGVTGVYSPPACYLVDEGEAEDFDRDFPPREKQKLPGQLV